MYHRSKLIKEKPKDSVEKGSRSIRKAGKTSTPPAEEGTGTGPEVYAGPRVTIKYGECIICQNPNPEYRLPTTGYRVSLFLCLVLSLLVIVMMTSTLLKHLRFLIQNLLCFKRGEKMQEEIERERQQELQRIQREADEFESGDWESREELDEQRESSNEQFSSEKSPNSQG